MSKRLFVCAVVAIAGNAAVAQPNAGTRLTDGDATFDYAFPGNLPTAHSAGGNVAMNMQVEGAPGSAANNQLPSGNWFYRFDGDTRERHLINANSRILTGSNEVEYIFEDVYTGGASNTKVADSRAYMHYSITDTGYRSARMHTELCIENYGGQVLTGQLFFVADIDLDNSPLNDAYQPLIGSGGPPGRQWNLVDGLAIGRMIGPGATGAGVGTFGPIMGAMTNSLVNNFPDSPNSGGTGGASDWYAVMQIPFTAAPNLTYCVGIDIDIDLSLVPAPGTLPALGFGALVATRRRRA